MKVLFAVDFSKHSRDAVQLFRRVQLPSESDVYLLHVNTPEEWQAPSASGKPSQLPSAITTLRDQATLHARKVLGQLAKVFKGQKVNLHMDVVDGNPGKEILKAIEQNEITLVVLGSRGLSQLAGLLLGSVSEWVLNEAPCSVLVSRPQARQKGTSSPMRIVLAIDGSPDAWAAVDFLVRLSFPKSSKLTLVSVVRKHVYQTEQVLIGGESKREQFAMLAEKILKARGREGVTLLEKVRERLIPLNLNVEERLVFGHEAQEILKAARHTRADLVIMGSRGLTGLRKLLLGSVSHKVSLNAPCSVLVVRSAKPEKKKPLTRKR